MMALCLTACSFSNHAPSDRDVYCGRYLLDITGTVPLTGAEGSSYAGMENEMDFHQEASSLTVYTHVSSSDMVATESYWGGMPGTIYKEDDGSNYLLFEDKVITQNYQQDGNDYTYKYILHNQPARLTENNTVLSWVINLRVEVELKGQTIYVGEAPVTNRAVRK